MDTLILIDSLPPIRISDDSITSTDTIPPIIIISDEELRAYEDSILESKKDFSVIFIKRNVTQSTDSLYFNVIKLTNRTPNNLSGKFNITLPSRFTLISLVDSIIEVPAGQSKYIPIRVSVSTEVEGGKNYILIADFEYNDTLVSKSSYIKIPSSRNWTMRLPSANYFVNNYNPISNIKINLSNKGNTTELIKLKFQIGKMISVESFFEGQDVLYVELSPLEDTVIILPIRYLEGPENSDEVNYRNLWKESSLSITASNKAYKRSDYISFTTIESHHTNIKAQQATPLNVELQVNNLLSGSPARYNALLYGNILFKKMRAINYQFIARNLLFVPLNKQDLSIENNAYYRVQYTDRTKSLEVGSQISGGILQGVTGRGIKGRWRPNNKNTLEVIAAQGRYNQYYAVAGQYTRRLFRSFSAIVGGGYEDRYTSNSTSAKLGTNFSLFKHHSFKAEGIISETKNSQNSPSTLPIDTSLIGYSYYLSYRLHYKNLRFNISNTNTLNNYNRNAGHNRWYSYASWRINSKLNITSHFDKSKIVNKYYGSILDTDRSFNNNDVGRITISYYTSNGITYMFGPLYNGITQHTYSNTTGITGDYKNLNLSLYFATRFSLKKARSITPSITWGLANASYETTDPNLQPTVSKNNIKNLRIGISYFSKTFRFYSSYNKGVGAVSQQQLMFNGSWENTESIMIRPQYEKYFYKNTIKVSSYLSYIYSMPSGRESANINLSLDFFLSHGWNFYISNNLYNTSHNDEEFGRITNRVFNIFLGIRKSFDLPQPRMKYYDYDFLFYHDINGNNIHEENEKTIPNMLMKIQRDRNIIQETSNFTEMELVSDLDGAISYQNLPEGEYLTTIKSLDESPKLHLLNGKNQKFVASEDSIVYIPLVESFRIDGRLILERDKNSGEGKIDISSIKVTATSETGDNYFSFTDIYGGFSISIPKSGNYMIQIANVLGENFTLKRSNYMVDLTYVKQVTIDFTFVEKERGVNFENQEYEFKTITNPDK